MVGYLTTGNKDCSLDLSGDQPYPCFQMLPKRFLKLLATVNDENQVVESG